MTALIKKFYKAHIDVKCFKWIKLRDLLSIDLRSEVMSTSTYVSRAEEMSRMRDLEDSFEDRYIFN